MYIQIYDEESNKTTFSYIFAAKYRTFAAADRSIGENAHDISQKYGDSPTRSSMILTEDNTILSKRTANLRAPFRPKVGTITPTSPDNEYLL